MEKNQIIAFAKKHWAEISVIALIIAFTAIKIQTLELVPVNRDEALYGWQSIAIYHNPELAFSLEINNEHSPFALRPLLASPLNAFFEPIAAVRIITFLFSLIALIFTYLAGKKIFSKEAGLAAMFLLAISPTFFYYATKAMPDVPIVALGTVLFYLLLTINKRRLMLVPFVILIMYLIKASSLIILPPTIIFLLVKYRKKLNLKYLIAILIMTAIIIWAGLVFSPYAESSKTFFGVGAPYEMIFGLGLRNFFWGTASIGISLLALFGAIKLRKKMTLNTGLILLWIIFATLPFLIIRTLSNRYYLFAIPPLAMIAGKGIAIMFENKKGTQKITIALVVALILIIPAMILTPTLWNGDFTEEYKKQEIEPVEEMIKENINSEDRLIIISTEYTMRAIRLSAEKGLKNPRTQMVVYPSQEEFEKIISDNSKNYYAIVSNEKLSGGTWIFQLTDQNWQNYLASQGFEEEFYIPKPNPALPESYWVYKSKN